MREETLKKKVARCLKKTKMLKLCVDCNGFTYQRILGTLCLRRTRWYPTEIDIEYLIGL